MKNVLNKESFNKYYVWSFTDDNEGHQPIYDFDGLLPLDKGTLFIKSKFITRDGLKFDGYVIGIENYYAFSLFCNNKECLFNLSLPQYYERSIKILEEELGIKHIDLFPLEYETVARNKNGEIIKGVFRYRG